MADAREGLAAQDTRRMLERLGVARSRISRAAAKRTCTDDFLRLVANELLAIGVEQTAVWCGCASTWCNGRAGEPIELRATDDVSSLPTALRLAADTHSAVEEGESLAVPLPCSIVPSARGALLVTGAGLGADAQPALEELAAVVGLGLGRAATEARLQAREQSCLHLFRSLRSGAAHCRVLFDDERAVDCAFLRVNEVFSSVSGLRGVEGKLLSEVLPGLRDADPLLLEICGRVARSGEPEHHKRFIELLGKRFVISWYHYGDDEILVVFDEKTAGAIDAPRPESAESLRLLLEYAPAAIALLDRDMRYLAASRRFAQDYRLELEDLRGRSHYEVFPEIDQRVREIHRRCLRGAVERCDGEAFPRADGSLDWVRWEVRPWHEASGAIGGIVLFSEVLTEQQRIVRALEASELRYRAIFEQAGVGMIHVDPPSGRFLAVNDKACEIFGYTSEELLRMSWPELTYPPDLPGDRALLVSLFAGDVASITREKRYLRKSGALMWGRVTVTRMDLGTETTFIALLEDISEHKQALDALRESDRRLATVFARSLAGMAVLRTADERFVDVSDSLVNMLGWSREELLGRAPNEFGLAVSAHARLGQLLEERGDPIEVHAHKKSGEEGVFLITGGPIEVLGEPCAILLVHEITALRRADVLLRQSEHELRSVFELAPIGLAQRDLVNDRFVRVNPRLCEITGYGAEELCALSVTNDLTHPDDRALTRAATEGGPNEVHLEKRYIRKDGKVIWIAMTATLPVDGHGGRAVGLAAIEDITARRQAGAELLIHKAALWAAANAVVITDPNARIQLVNPAFCALTGYSEQEIVGKDMSVLKSGKHDAAYYAELWRTVSAGKTWRGELVNRKKDGSLYHEDMTITPLLDERGRVAQYVAIQQDITERKRAERELRDSEERYRTLVDNLEDVVFTLDADGRITFVNRAVESFGHRPEEVVGRPIELLLHADDRAVARAMFAERDSPARELRLIDAGGRTRPVRVRVRARRGGDELLGVTGVLVDLTARRETEEQLRAAQKMEAVGRLAGGVAHDFNNLLSVILSYSALALESLKPEDEIRSDLEEVIHAGQRAEGLTRQLLAFSRRELLAPEPLDLDELLGGLVKMLRRLIGEDIELRILTHGALPPTKVDRGAMEQVIMNLIVNARDAMPDGGVVTVATRPVVLDAESAQALEVPPAEYVEVLVKDTGCGMDDAVQARIFEPFFTTKAPGKGTGLGLSMVYGIVRQSGGSVKVESAPDHGSSFAIYLPRQAAAQQGAVSRVTTLHPRRGTECVLVIEDETALRAVIRRALSAAGYEVLPAATAGQALALARAHGSRVRLILSDVVMPVMGGRELVEKLRPLCPAARVIFMSGYTDEAIERLGVLSSEFLRKPFDGRLLTEKVRAVLDAEPAPD